MPKQILDILLVKYDQEEAGRLQHFLQEQYSFRIDTSHNAAEARDRFIHTVPYNVVVIDDLLPEQQGDKPEPAGINLMRHINNRVYQDLSISKLLIYNTIS